MDIATNKIKCEMHPPRIFPQMDFGLSTSGFSWKIIRMGHYVSFLKTKQDEKTKLQQNFNVSIIKLWQSTQNACLLSEKKKKNSRW